ncbi:hypothetical protein L3081_21150 [Colwellia sp. MSW7]|jgi:hypothetical protein|uniref:Carboxypeptidase regulatory-like domain-containing protein n=1 Tax=Colwellia maritima TaxID=2912588 RepID=A0ABS9X5S1_9GAMM|nr:hypothetical protein [Colwellia maritima]MCI2285435.1 hypothetical protein [Colwellia maritima]
MGLLSDILAKTKKAFSSKKVAQSTEECPLKKTGVLVTVVKQENNQTIADATVDISGKSPFTKKSDPDGVALFKPVEPDDYKIDITLPAAIKDDYDIVETQSQSVPLGSCPIHIVFVKKRAKLKVKVFEQTDTTQFIGNATVSIEGTETYPSQQTAETDGIADFGKVKADTYKITVTLSSEDAKIYSEPKAQTITLQPADEITQDIEIKKKRVALKLVLTSWDFATGTDIPKAGLTWEMKQPVAKSGITQADGIIDVEVPDGTTAADLEVEWRSVTPKVTQAVSSPVVVDDYPQKVQHAQWEDEYTDKVIPDSADDIANWSFTVVPHASIDNDGGAIKRLHNLGFDSNAISTAVRAYQYSYLKNATGSGVIADIKPDIIKRHDNP